MKKLIPWVLYLIYFRFGKWKARMQPPDGIRKAVVIAVPHTATEDFPVGLGASYLMGGRHGFLGKKELFEGPFGWLFRYLGGIPVDRSSSSNLVEQAAGYFDTEDEFYLVMAPEGTRQRTERWRTGFYQIAKRAGVPVLLGYIDFGRREVGIDTALYPSEDEERDFRIISEFYRSKTAKYPERFNPNVR